MEEEFNRQVKNLVNKGYPEMAGLSKDEFIKMVQSLQIHLRGLKDKKADIVNGYLPFVIVVQNKLVPSEKMMDAVEFNAKPGFTKLYPHTTDDYKIVGGMSVPESGVYLLIDIDRGKETINVTPEKALDILKGRHRFPLTIEEGIALITQFPEFLIKNNCFSLLASRTGKDQRVPAIWINAAKQANLGWCWDRNPHTWLGSASAKLRIS